MPVTARFFRFRLRNALDSADTLVLTSHPSGTNPYLAEPPRGDGSDVDVVSGRIGHGAYTVLAVDPSGTPITAILADASGFWQPLGRKAYIETSTDGSAWSVQVPGYVQAVRFPDARTAEFTVGDVQRIDLTREVFGEVTANFFGATGLIGGPCVGGSGPFLDRGTWRMRVVDATAGPPGDVGLTLVKGTIPSPTGYVAASTISIFARDYINGRAQQYAVGGFTVYEFPDLIVRATPAGGGAATFHTPYARVPLFNAGPPDTLINADNLLTVAWVGTLPSVNDEFDVYVYPRRVSPENPLHVQGHPVDILTDLWDEAGIEWDSTTAAAVKTALGPDAWTDLRYESGMTLDQWQTENVFGPHGVGFRLGTDGERELFLGRKRSASSPGTTITTAEILGHPEDQPILFDLDESTIVDALTFRTREFSRWTPDLDVERPPDDVVSSERAVTVLREGVTSPNHEVEYSIQGMIRVGTGGFDAFVIAAAADLLLRFGFGCPYLELIVTEAVAEALGNEILLTAAHQINGNTRGGSRVLQVVRRTLDLGNGGVALKLLDAGANSQIATAPTLALAAIGKNGVEVEVTNKATLDAAGWFVRLEWGFGGSAPAEGAFLKLLSPTDADTFEAPQVDSGVHVWVQARSEHPDRRPSAWATWAGLNLTDLVAPSGLSRSGNVYAFTAGESDRRTRVRLTFNSRTDVLELLPAGSTSFDFTPFVPPSTSVTVGFAHIDDPPYAGISTEATDSYTTAAATALATPVAPVKIQGSVEGGERIDGLIGMEATATEHPSSMEFEVAVETAVGSGSYGTSTRYAIVPSVVGGPTRATILAARDGRTRRFKARLVAPQRTASSYTSNIDVIPWSAIVRPPLRRGNLPIMNDTGTLAGYPARAEDTLGTTLPSNTVQTDGVTTRSLMKGHQGGDAVHGGAITFSPTFQSTPLILLRGGILHEPRAKWGTAAAVDAGTASSAYSTTQPTIEDMTALNPSASGFTLRARLRQPGTLTARSHDFPSSNDLDTDEEATEVTLSNAPAVDDTYTVHFSVAMSIASGESEGSSLDVTVAIDSGVETGGSTVWTERQTLTYNVTAAAADVGSSSLSHQTMVMTVSGLDTTDKVRLRIKDIALVGAGASITNLTVHGFDGSGDPAAGVTYTTDAGPQYASKTSDAGVSVEWEAMLV